MGSEWQAITLGEIVKEGNGLIQTGPFGSQLHASDYVSDGIPVIMPVNIAGDRIDLTDIARIKEEDANRLSKHLVQKGDIIYSRRGDVTRKALITASEIGMFCGTGCLLVRPGSKIDPKFLTYHLSSPKNQEWIVRHAIGATMPNLNTGILSDVPLKVPSRVLQRAIAHILGSLDDKIELNRQMNATLEAMAQALFKSWFVDFDPVIDKALTAGNPIPEPLRKRAEARQSLGGQRKPLPADIAQHFPDSFVFNEEMGWVPEGWEVGKFRDIANHIRVSVKAEEVEKYDFYVGLEHIEKKHLFLYQKASGASVSSNKSRFEKKDLLFGKLRPYFHKVCLAPCQGICSTDILVFKAKSNSFHSYMTLTAFTEKFIDYANMRSTGTRMPRASVKDMLAYAIPLPSEKILGSFESILAPMWRKGMESVENGHKLGTLRDTLLPKLLTGQLRIPDAEQMIQEN